MEPSQKPCSNCRRRKVRCDKAFPCSNCVRLKYRCSYEDQSDTTPSALVLDQPATAELWDRLSRLENMIGNLDTRGKHPSGHESSTDLSGVVDKNPREGSASEFNLPQAVEGPKSSIRSPPSSESTFPFVPTAFPDQTSLPSSPQFNPLLELFLEITEPFIRMSHVPKLRQDLQNHQQGISSKEFEALLRCIHAVTIVTLPASFVLDLFGTPRNDLTQALLRLAEKALQKADFLMSIDLTVLQAILYYITTLFECLEGVKASAMIGIALRHALHLGLHRDPSHLSPQMVPVEAETRRRVWCYLQHLDFRAQELLNVESCMSGPAYWDTCVPLNLDDDAFEDIANGSLRNRMIPGFTNMTFVVTRSRINRLERQIMESENGTTTPNSLDDMKKMIETCRREMDFLYLNDIDTSNPIQRLVASIIRTRLLKIELLARRKEAPMPLEIAEAFQTGLTNLNADPDFVRWSWLLPSRHV
jgi:Fungal specific transcription factor domain/Fungal Zn(2)-Cys(6) binuclear cluster domain